MREANLIRVEARAPELPASAVMAAADARFADLPHRTVEVLHVDTGNALRPAFEAAGWTTTRHLLMAHLKPGEPLTSSLRVEPVAPEAVWHLREEWIRAELGGAERPPSSPESTDAPAAQILSWEIERARVTGASAFCVRDSEGRPSSMCLLMRTAHADEIELVYTSPAHRRRGLALAVVARALRAAGDELTFLFTDADGAAQRLYGRLGFLPTGLVHRFVQAAP